MADDPFDIFDEPAPAPVHKIGGEIPSDAKPPARTFADFQREKAARPLKPDPAMDRAQTYPDRFGVAARPEVIGTRVASVRGTPDEPCGLPFSPGGHKCRIGGGNANLTDDHGRTWFCVLHRPEGFFPHDR